MTPKNIAANKNSTSIKQLKKEVPDLYVGHFLRLSGTHSVSPLSVPESHRPRGFALFIPSQEVHYNEPSSNEPSSKEVVCTSWHFPMRNMRPQHDPLGFVMLFWTISTFDGSNRRRQKPVWPPHNH